MSPYLYFALARMTSANAFAKLCAIGCSLSFRSLAKSVDQTKAVSMCVSIGVRSSYAHPLCCCKNALVFCAPPPLQEQHCLLTALKSYHETHIGGTYLVYQQYLGVLYAYAVVLVSPCSGTRLGHCSTREASTHAYSIVLLRMYLSFYMLKHIQNILLLLWRF